MSERTPRRWDVAMLRSDISRCWFIVEADSAEEAEEKARVAAEAAPFPGEWESESTEYDLEDRPREIDPEAAASYVDEREEAQP